MIAALDATATSIRTQLVLIEANTLGATGLVHHWDEYWQHLKLEMPNFSRQVVTDYIKLAINLFNEHRPSDYALKMQVVHAWLAEIGNMYIPDDNS